MDALADPDIASQWPRFLTLSEFLGGPATQASLEMSEECVKIVWRDLQSGVVGEVVAVQELSFPRLDGWLRMLRPSGTTWRGEESTASDCPRPARPRSGLAHWSAGASSTGANSRLSKQGSRPSGFSLQPAP